MVVICVNLVFQPFPEGYRVFIMQASGDRLIILEPVPGCVNNCSRVSVLLHATDFSTYPSKMSCCFSL